MRVSYLETSSYCGRKELIEAHRQPMSSTHGPSSSPPSSGMLSSADYLLLSCIGDHGEIGTYFLGLEIRHLPLRTTLNQKLFALLLLPTLPSRSRWLVLSFSTLLGVEFDLYGTSSSIVGVLKKFSASGKVARE